MNLSFIEVIILFNKSSFNNKSIIKYVIIPIIVIIISFVTGELNRFENKMQINVMIVVAKRYLQKVVNNFLVKISL